jgi:hypothetical protein
METAAAILVQTLFDANPRLQTLLRTETDKGTDASLLAAQFLKPYYVAMLASLKQDQQLEVKT